VHFERCIAWNKNTSGAVEQIAAGGAIYVGDFTGLDLQLATFNTDSALVENVTATSQANDWRMRGGAIAVSKYSGNPSFTPPDATPDPSERAPGLAIRKRATFLGNFAGMGGAIHMDWRNNGSLTINGPMLNIDGDNVIQTSPSVLRDSGLIQFISNTALREGGAIYQNWYTYLTGYLAPQTHVLPRWDSVELRMRFVNNAAGLAGGALYLNPNSQPDLQERRVWYEANFVDPSNPRLSREAYKNIVVGGGAVLNGTGDSCFAVEFHRNYVIGGNGGAYHMTLGQSGPNQGQYHYFRYFVENGFNAGDQKLSPLPFDPRELTRFCENWATVGEDSLGMFNRAGRGGAMYVDINNASSNIPVLDTLISSRARFEKNQAFSGSAIHSDNYKLHIMANQTLIANNFATSRHSATVDLVAPEMASPHDPNAGATIWGDLEGPIPSHESNSRGNAIYDNRARYVLRLPDAEGPGFGGIDTLRGNFWGETGVDIITKLPQLPVGAIQSTFFIDYFDSCFTDVYEPNRAGSYTYTPVPIGTVPDTLLFEGRVYDIYDKGLDIKTVDYNNRRMAIAEAFSLGLPTDVGRPPLRRGLHRFTRDIFTKDPVYLNTIMQYQIDFTGPHPIGYPLFLQADIDSLDFNRDECARNYTVVFVLNETTQEFVRVNLKEELEDRHDSATMPYKGRIDFVPDSTVATRHPFARAKVFWSPTLIRPSSTTYDEIARAAKLEDSAALDGRYYELSLAQLQGTGFADTVCTQGITGATQWYAGERYGTLPVRPGDQIAVFSRTQLWKYGFAGAKSRGLTFSIGDVLPPLFTGDIVTIMTDSIHPGRLFAREDFSYEAFDTVGNNPILVRVTGYDPNLMLNPAWLFDPFNYTQLDISTKFHEEDSLNFRLPWWLQRDTIYGGIGVGASGYVQLFGNPHNTDVVPGGESVTVTLTNWPPNFASEHVLLDNFDAVLGTDSLKLSHWIFPPYFHCPEGFLKDTLCVRRTATTFTFRIFVQDSLPIFLSTPSVACAANLTDSLRYDYDLNTDDEFEDSAAYNRSVEAGWWQYDSTNFPVIDSIFHDRTWDFRYGRTAYDLLVAPQWLKEYYAARAGEAGIFELYGDMKIRMPASEVYPLITPTPQVNNELLLDTIVAIEVDDGHTGKRTQQWRLPINVEPTITTTTLPRAKEDFEYSTYFNDTSLLPRIVVTDPNFGDFHTFRLIYKGTDDSVYRDNRYKAGGELVRGTTPAWLKINPISGVLYGVPGLDDAPHNSDVTDCGGPDTVTVVVEDVCGLTDWIRLVLEVDSSAHPPKFLRGPRTLCVRNKTPFCDSVMIVDRDLMRPCPFDTLRFTMLEPDTAFTVTPLEIRGQLGSDTAWVLICGQFNEDDQYFINEPLEPRFISVDVVDAQGNRDTIRYRVNVGDIPTFECDIYVSNKGTATHPVDIQKLCFGAGRFGRDTLDIRYCELEVPPPGPTSVFDARWELPVGGSVKGTHIDIRRDTNQFATVTWQVRFKSGSDANGSFLYPVEICWNSSCLDSANTGPFSSGNFFLQHPNTVSEFSLNMRSGDGPINNTFYTLRRITADSLCLEIKNVGLDNARIVFIPAKAAVSDRESSVFALEQNYPNPFNPSTTIRFAVAERRDVRLDIYDVKGTLVRTLVNEVVEQGSYPVVWDGTNAAGVVMPSGTYIAKMTAGDYTSSIKMTLNK
jgi:predicted outer membrane repeat protein